MCFNTYIYLYKLDAELRAVFEATCFEHEAPCPATHASSKTVNAGAVTGFWLMGSFWHMNPRLTDIEPGGK